MFRRRSPSTSPHRQARLELVALEGRTVPASQVPALSPELAAGVEQTQADTPVKASTLSASQIAVLQGLNLSSSNLARDQALTPEHQRLMDRALAIADNIARLVDGLAQMDQAAGDKFALGDHGEPFKDLIDALRRAGLGDDMIERLFGSGGGGFDLGSLLGRGEQEDWTGLADQPGWTAGADLASLLGAPGGRTSVAGSDYVDGTDVADSELAVEVTRTPANDGTIVTFADGTWRALSDSVPITVPGIRGKPTTFSTSMTDTGFTVTVQRRGAFEGSTHTYTSTFNYDSSLIQKFERTYEYPGLFTRTLTYTRGVGFERTFTIHYKKDAAERPANEDGLERGPLATAAEWYTNMIAPYINPSEFAGGNWDPSRFARSLVAYWQIRLGCPSPDGPMIDLGGGKGGGIPWDDLPDEVDDLPPPGLPPKPSTGPNPVPPLPPGAVEARLAAPAGTADDTLAPPATEANEEVPEGRG